MWGNFVYIAVYKKAKSAISRLKSIDTAKLILAKSRLKSILIAKVKNTPPSQINMTQKKTYPYTEMGLMTKRMEDEGYWIDFDGKLRLPTLMNFAIKLKKGLDKMKNISK